MGREYEFNFTLRDASIFVCLLVCFLLLGCLGCFVLLFFFVCLFVCLFLGGGLFFVDFYITVYRSTDI